MVQAGVHHFLIAGAAFCLLGALAHVARAVFNVFPDRLSDNDRMDMIISNGHSWGDKIFGTEYDDAGYYQLDSVKNLKNSVLACLISGWAVMLTAPGLSSLVATGIDASGVWLWNLFIYRLQTVSLW